MSITERVTELRSQQKRAEQEALQEQSRRSVVENRDKEQIKDENTAAFKGFVRRMGLKGRLNDLIRAEKLEDARIVVTEMGPSADKIKLSLRWKGRPERHYQPGVISGPVVGFLSISITRESSGRVLVEGGKYVAEFQGVSLKGREAKEDLEKAIAQAYLKPKWNEQYLQLRYSSGVKATDLERWPPELRD